MTEHPILFSGPMVRAILAGTKTQTRRPVKFSRPFTEHRHWSACYPHTKGGWIFTDPPLPEPVREKWIRAMSTGRDGKHCPFGVPGDRLWVKETWWQIPEPSLRQLRNGADTWPKVAYDADESDVCREQNREMGWRLRPSIYLPRKFSRITLEVTDVRVERVQSVTEGDAFKEGVEPIIHSGILVDEECYRRGFTESWQRTYPGSWERNDWVWVIGFRRLTCR